MGTFNYFTIRPCILTTIALSLTAIILSALALKLCSFYAIEVEYEYFSYSTITHEYFGLFPHSCSNHQKVYLSSVDISSIEMISLLFGMASLVLGSCSTITLLIAFFRCFRNDSSNTMFRRILLLCMCFCFTLCSVFQGCTFLIFDGLICTESEVEGRKCSLGVAGICSTIATLLWFLVGVIIFMIVAKHPSLQKNHSDVVLSNNTTHQRYGTKITHKNQTYELDDTSANIATGIPAQIKISQVTNSTQSITSISSGSVYNF